jgi:lipopolysaccharide transport system ATP-binding protein
MSSDMLLRLSGAAKTYPRSRQPGRELLTHLLSLPSRHDHRHALHPIDLEVHRGESVGIVGLNGAGKSTLLQLAAGVLTPSEGTVAIHGRVAALLELGSAFNPEASGLDNIFLYAATLGMPRAAMEAQLDDIIDFSGLREFIELPVKSYSTGMQVRLAFSVATSVNPDLLIVDEALSVGDGVFAKRSFDRIMGLREAGTALLLSSHALFHVDLFCKRTLWLHRGRLRAWGDTRQVLPGYQEFLDQQVQQSTIASTGQATSNAQVEAEASNDPANDPAVQADVEPAAHPSTLTQAPDPALAQLRRATVWLDGRSEEPLSGKGGISNLEVVFEIQASSAEPSPRAALVLSSESGKIIGTSVSEPGAFIGDAFDRGVLVCRLVGLPLNRGRYRVGVYLLDAPGRFVYAWSDPHAHVQIDHQGAHQGPWLIPALWESGPPSPPRSS